MPEYIYLDDELDIDENEVFVGFIRKNCEMLIRCKDCKWFGHEITEELTEYGFYNEVHETFCYRQLANGMNDAFDVCVDDFCSWAERKEA